MTRDKRDEWVRTEVHIETGRKLGSEDVEVDWVEKKRNEDTDDSIEGKK